MRKNRPENKQVTTRVVDSNQNDAQKFDRL